MIKTITKNDFKNQLKASKQHGLNTILISNENKTLDDIIKISIDAIDQNNFDHNTINRKDYIVTEKSNCVKINNSRIDFFAGDQFIKYKNNLIKFNISKDSSNLIITFYLNVK